MKKKNESNEFTDKYNDSKRWQLSRKQRRDLISRLKEEGYAISSQGHVEVITVLPEHPRFCGCPLPVGFIDKNFSQLVNTEKKFLNGYHQVVSEIYDFVILGKEYEEKFKDDKFREEEFKRIQEASFEY